MIETADILYSVTGQSLVFDAPEGRPSSVTSVVVQENASDDDATAELATTGSAAVETNPNTTFDAGSGASQSDPSRCNLTATTGIAVGRRYLATTATGEKEWLDVKYILAADYILTRQPLANDFTVGDTLLSTRMSISIDSTWVATNNNVSVQTDPNPRYRVRWTYVVAGVTHVHATYFDLVRYRGQHHVAGLDVDRAFPGWLDALPTYYREDQGAQVIEEAYRQVKMDLYRHNLADQLIRNAEAVDNLVLYKSNAIGRLNQPADIAEYARKLYGEELQNLISWPKVTMDVTGHGSGTTNVSAYPVWRR